MITSETDPGEDGVVNAGDPIEYNMNVTNTGNTCLMGLRVMDKGMASIQCDAWYPGGICTVNRCACMACVQAPGQNVRWFSDKMDRPCEEALLTSRCDLCWYLNRRIHIDMLASVK